MTWICAVLFGCGIALSGTTALAQSGSYSVLYKFQGGSDGANPAATLIDVAGTLYGTTEKGGTSYGTVFAVNLNSGAEQVVYALPYTVGVDPEGSLINVKGMLYGTASQGGDDGKCRQCGTVFSVNPTTNKGQLVYPFQTIAGGTFPAAGLIEVHGKLYGTTVGGGDNNNCNHVKYRARGCGTVFSLDLNTGAETVVYSFKSGVDGAYPYGSLINVGGKLYGTTVAGGTGVQCTSGCGTVFSLNPTTGAEKVVYSFRTNLESGDGVSPSAGLINDGSTLYGTTTEGGANCSCGTVFSLDLSTGVETVVYAFEGNTDGVAPFASLVDFGGTLYGTTSGGGTSNKGILFSVDPATGKENVLHNFGFGDDGASPMSGLINVSSTLYGTTYEGGNSAGTVYSFTP